MRDGIIYDCPHADCRTPIYTGKCRRECLERYNKEMGSRPMTNADRIRAMSDEELAEFLESTHSNMAIKLGGEYLVRAKEYIGIWLQQPAEGE